MKNVQLLAKKAIDILSEAETYFSYRQSLTTSMQRLFKQYQEGRFTYAQYEQAQRSILKGKTADEMTRYYDAYILTLLRRVETYNNQIFYEAYNDQQYMALPSPQPLVAKVVAKKPAPSALGVPPGVPAVRPDSALSKIPSRGLPATIAAARPPVTVATRAGKEEAAAQRPVAQRPAAKAAEKEAVDAEERISSEISPPEEESVAAQPMGVSSAAPKLVEIKPDFLDKIASFFNRMFAGREVRSKIKELQAQTAQTAQTAKAKPGSEKYSKTPLQKKMMAEAAEPAAQQPTATPAHKHALIHKKTIKDMLFNLLARKPEKLFKPHDAQRGALEKKADEGIIVSGFLSMSTIKRMFGIKDQRVSYSDKDTELGHSMLQLETLRRRAQPDIEDEIEKITSTALTKEASRIRAIMQRRKTLKIYQPSFFGSLANITIKKISLFLMDNFPDFFKELYHALRLANIKVLSNTYVNMLVLGVTVSFLIGLVVMGVFFANTSLPIAQVLFRTVMMALLVALVTFAGFYQYPYSVLKQRRRSINSNLPFAINHMAAVASSGVAPTKMFQLISQSKEYGEISTEIEKIVNYVEIFGYDLLTALKSVAATTPSDAFKDFLEGMVSTTESGGDIKSFLVQKADEAIMNYKLDRQKYTETIATYSDIYTGILIAAPLFFVAALSLVSLLGGKIGGIGVNVIIVLGTYVMIPILNIGFLAFLTMTQPEI